MTTTPTADRVHRLVASRPSTMPVRSPYAGRSGRGGATIHHTLAEAPVGGHAMLEAALAWQLLRPAERANTGEGAGAAVPRHLPVVETRSEAVAARIARLLSGLAWAIVTPVETGPGRAPAVRVEVPRGLYHLVLRALANAWRDARRQFDPRHPNTEMDAEAAVALWRMGILLSGLGNSHNMIYLHTGTSMVAEVLETAARRLGLAPITDHSQSGPAVTLHHPGEVHWLLTEAEAGGAGTVRTRVSRPTRLLR
ncbi:hypothetical protein [Streptosporangium sp. NBC_01756]|uniref:hypothetical protein n=1 Tax=Streptosporangium sp. NBC_01756 TaxID=2975950 RepID=UPI002DDB7165|nr:hypothetical protein [Streptosporangium sp. NBC_01756]WSC88362.1 hypothetical protein OIE48_09305 [Streptosporangium sp. NBC_01756]